MNSDHAIGATVVGSPSLLGWLTIYFMPPDKVDPTTLATAKAALVVYGVIAVTSLAAWGVRAIWPKIPALPNVQPEQVPQAQQQH